MGSMSHAKITGLYTHAVSASDFVNAIPAAMLLLDTQYRVVGCNSACEHLLGIHSQQVCGTPCHHVVCTAQCFKDCPVKGAEVLDTTASFQNELITHHREKLLVRHTVLGLHDVLDAPVGYIAVLEKVVASAVAESLSQVPFTYAGMVANSPQMQTVLERVPDIAQSAATVLITGETGTGKDLLAEAIHSASPRQGGQFVKVNCGALPEQLLESELFGHVKGAFTGAVADKKGRIQAAHNGTLFLTEIGDLPLHLQVKLLTFLDDQQIYPVGSSEPVSVNTRVISATHRDLHQMVQDGAFREDLLFRLNVVRLHLPALRERGEDLDLLLHSFLSSLATLHNKSVAHFTQNALSLLRHYPFPGNIRELRNIVEYAVVFCRSSQITPADLPSYVVDYSPQCPEDTLLQPASFPANHDTWAENERDLIIQALRRAGGKKQQAATHLGWGRSTLWRKMKQHGLLE